jgi:hypothetical protein
MEGTLVLSPDSRSTAGILLLAIVGVEWGGTYMLSIVRGRQAVTGFQRSFHRAGHAHAGVLVILALVSLVIIDAADLSGLSATLARNTIPLAAILFPAGFFFSSLGRGVTKPNRFILLLYAGAISLAVGVVSLGVGLLSS